jgi:peroxiredoxin
MLPPGNPAPDFRLRVTPDETVSLADFRGNPLILAFYPADWSPVCGDQLALYNEILPEFQRHNARLLAISVDGVWCHLAYAEHRKLQFPLLSDFEPKGDRKQEGVAERALFVIDAEGTVFWNYLSPIGVNPGADGILVALEALEAKQEAVR